MALSEAALGVDSSYPAQPPQVAAIRRAVSALARRGGADLTMIIRLELAVSEAATNVVLHAYREPGATGRIHVTVCIEHGAFDVCIRDTGSGMAPRPDSPGMGLGLSLMASESDRFEVRCAEGGGTEVLLRFLLPEPPVGPPRRRITSTAAAAGERARA
jgi:serine/threonine-protein kinase RsbW